MKTKKNVFFTWNTLRFLKHDIKSTMREKMIIYWTILKLETSDQNLNTGNTECWWEYGEWELSFIVDGNAKWYSHSEDNLVVTYKAKYTFSIQCNSHAPWYLSKEADKSFSSTKNLHMNIYGSYIHNCQHLEAAKMSFSRWMDKYINKEIFFSAEKKWAIKP